MQRFISPAAAQIVLIFFSLKVGLSIGKSRSAPLNFLRDNEKLTVKFERTYDFNDKINFI